VKSRRVHELPLGLSISPACFVGKIFSDKNRAECCVMLLFDYQGQPLAREKLL
jgi:hypothetical protein